MTLIQKLEHLISTRKDKREGKREGEDVVGREGHSGRKVQSAFRGAASGLVNNCVQRNWTTVDRTV